MSTSPDTFDALAVVVDWLDAGQSADLDALLNLYGDDATLACDCEGVILTGREALSAYWEPKLASRSEIAFSLDDMVLTDDGLQIDCQSYEGKPVRIRFRFTPSGKSSTQAAVRFAMCHSVKLKTDPPQPAERRYRRDHRGLHVGPVRRLRR
jgi:hypothetical protein